MTNDNNDADEIIARLKYTKKELEETLVYKWLKFNYGKRSYYSL